MQRRTYQPEECVATHGYELLDAAVVRFVMLVAAQYGGACSTSSTERGRPGCRHSHRSNGPPPATTLRSVLSSRQRAAGRSSQADSSREQPIEADRPRIGWLRRDDSRREPALGTESLCDRVRFGA